MIINESFLRRYADENNILSRRSLIFESLTHSDSQDDFDIFISHSSLDQKCTLALIELLEKDGIKAYVDFIQDTSMSPNNVTIETAKKIRSRLNQCISRLNSICFELNHRLIFRLFFNKCFQFTKYFFLILQCDFMTFNFGD